MRTFHVKLIVVGAHYAAYAVPNIDLGCLGGTWLAASPRRNVAATWATLGRA